MKRLFVLFLPVIIVGFFLMPGTGSATSTIPCSDPRGCPDLQIISSDISMGDWFIAKPQKFQPTDCAVLEGNVQAGVRTLLKFSTGILNTGKGALNLGNMQALAQSNPDIVYWDTCHQHFHIRGFAAYRLWTPTQYQAWLAAKKGSKSSDDNLLATHPELTPIVDRKVGFCPVDLIPYARVKGQWEVSQDYSGQVYTGYCGNPSTPDPGDTAGISPGWSDNYYRLTEAQWVDVTGLHGTFILENEVNPARFIEESNYRNDSATVTVTIP